MTYYFACIKKKERKVSWIMPRQDVVGGLVHKTVAMQTRSELNRWPWKTRLFHQMATEIRDANSNWIRKLQGGKPNHSLEVEALLISCNSQYILTTAAAAADKWAHSPKHGACTSTPSCKKPKMSPRVKPVTTKGGKKQLLNGNLNTKEKQVGCCLPVWLRPFPHFLGRFFLRLLEMTAEQRMIDFYERHLPFLALETLI